MWIVVYTTVYILLPAGRAEPPPQSRREAFRFLLWVAVVVARRHRGRRRPASASALTRPTSSWPSAAPATAGALLLERFGGPAAGVDSKSSSTDMVSDADREAEEAIAAICCAPSGPDDGLLGEEGASRGGASSGRRWVVDPLDGTTNFLYGYPALVRQRGARGRRRRAGGRRVRPGARRAVRGRARRRRDAGRRADRGCATARRSTARWSPPASATTPTAARARPRCCGRVLPARARHPPGGRGGARPGLAGRRAPRRLLRARPQALGLGGGTPPRHGGGRRGG